MPQPTTLLRSKKSFFISYFNVKRTIWLKIYQNGNHIEPSKQRLQEISIAKNRLSAGFKPATCGLWIYTKAAGSNLALGYFFEMLIFCSRCSYGSMWLPFW